jgi:glycosyltransferase involved in cell wall biosynthesis
MKVSVVVPANNEEEYIQPCLESLNNQIVKPAQIIVVDNNCQDKTALLAKKFEVKIIKEKRLGLVFARNCGFDAVKTEVIARCDADTTVSPDWTKKIIKNFSSHKIDALAGPVEAYDLPFKILALNKAFLSLLKKTKGHYFLIGSNMSLTKKIWNKIKNKVCLNSTNIHEDLDLSLHIAEAGGNIFYDPSLIVKTSARRFKKNLKSFLIDYQLKTIYTLTSHLKI